MERQTCRRSAQRSQMKNDDAGFQRPFVSVLKGVFDHSKNLLFRRFDGFSFHCPSLS